jgi:UDP-2-acetamido-2-deoxy-ribo-hexuluronate aminotransferase
MDFIDLKSQYRAYRSEIDRRIQNVLDGAGFILGKENRELEEKLAAYVGAKYALAVGSGTDALLLPLLAMGIHSGDEIITVPYTFVATAEVVSFVGAKPVFVDIDEKNYNMDVSQIESKITSKTKGIIPVSLYGQAADMDAINNIAKKHGLWVLEDACQSFGAIYKGRKSCGLSDLAATSFFPSKPLGCYGDGGMVFANDEELFRKMKSIHNQGQTERYIHKYVGLNMRLDSLQCAVLLAKFEHFEEEAEKRFAIGRLYSELMSGLPVITPTLESYTGRSVFAQFSIRVKNRDEVSKKLNASGIPTAVHYPIPIHLQQAYSYLGYKMSDFPVSERVSSEIMSLPMHPFLDEATMKEIVGKLGEALR